MELPENCLEFYGVLALQRMLRCGTPAIHRKLGEPAGTLRIGCMEAPIWLAELVQGVPFKPIPRTVFYTLNESARYVGITRPTFKRIAPEAPGIMVSGNLWSRNIPIWPESMLHDLRCKIAEGSIRVRWQSLTRPKARVCIVSPRHTQAENQTAESIAYSKAHAWVQSVLT
jgi:hypothetical protein